MTQPTTIALVRHGQTPWNADMRIQGRTDIALNDTGREQAREAVGRLGTKWNVVSSSPLSRAAETAEIIAQGLELPQPELVEHLIERHFGKAEGLSAGEALDSVRTIDGFVDAEPADVVAARGIAAVEHLRDAHAGKHIIAVSHGAFIRVTLSALFDFDSPRINNTSISIIRHDADGWTLESVNGVPIAELELVPSGY